MKDLDLYMTIPPENHLVANPRMVQAVQASDHQARVTTGVKARWTGVLSKPNEEEKKTA